MFNRITTLKVASVALAASAIFASTPAAAETVNHHRSASSSLLLKKKAVALKKVNASRFNRFNNRGFNRVRSNGFGQSAFLTAKLKRNALASCSSQLRHDAFSFGYKGATLTGADVRQVGRNKFVVHAGAKLYDGYSFNHEPYKCTVVHGKIIDAFKPKKLRF